VYILYETTCNSIFTVPQGYFCRNLKISFGSAIPQPVNRRPLVADNGFLNLTAIYLGILMQNKSGKRRDYSWVASVFSCQCYSKNTCIKRDKTLITMN